MTELRLGQSLTRKTSATVRSRALVVKLHPGYLELREAGTRTAFSLTYDAAYRYAARLAADKLVAERNEQKKAKKREWYPSLI